MIATEFESLICNLTQPLNGQYPRPWMTKLRNPRQAKVFIVGKNQSKAFTVDKVGSHKRHLDSLFNRNGESCFGLYDEVTGGVPSPTRRNINALTRRLETRGINDLLETNVICYSTAMSSHLTNLIHKGGRQKGDEIFRTLLAHIRPPVLIAHGSDTRNKLALALSTSLPAPAQTPGNMVSVRLQHDDYSPIVFIIPSLAPPAYNRWHSWSSHYLDSVAEEICNELGRFCM